MVQRTGLHRQLPEPPPLRRASSPCSVLLRSILEPNMGLKRTATKASNTTNSKMARIVSVRAEPRPEQDSAPPGPAPVRPRARLYHCSWCGRNLRSRKLIRKVTHVAEVPWKSPIDEDIIAGTFLCQPTCYLAWMNRSGQLRYKSPFSRCDLVQ